LRGSGRAVVAALDRAQEWLELHRESLLPDAALFWKLSIDLTHQRGDGPDHRRPPAASELQLSSDYLALVRRVSALLRRLPLLGSPRWQPAGGRLPIGRRSPGLASSIAVDVTVINRALVEASSGAMSAHAGRWARNHASSTGYTLTHKLLALVFEAAARGERALPAHGVPVAEKALAELGQELGGTYVDLTAQRVACLALAGCPPDALATGIQWLVRHQRRAGDWDYFESRVDGYQTIERVHTGRSPLLRPPLWKERRDPMMEAPRIELAHRGHATAVAAAALACVVSG
jgi:hypothetical protein